MGYHEPVMLHECMEGLRIRPEGTYVDLTFGGGGHSREVLKKLGNQGRLIAFDRDRDSEKNVPDDARFTFIRANYRYLQNFLRYYGMEKVDGILADLGISSHQIDRPERGFSFKQDTDLDMRMDRGRDWTAARVLNEYPARDLIRIMSSYGELPRAGAIVRAITAAREQHALETSADLEKVLAGFIPKGRPHKFLARIYQALRMEVNQEMEALEVMLAQTAGHLVIGGRLVVITYHSVEDRMVKNFMRSGDPRGEVQKDFYGNVRTPWKLVNRKVITPSREEVEKNNRARSAKLRIAERIRDG